MAPSSRSLMVPAQSSPPPGPRGSRPRRARAGWSWTTWLLVGLCFGLGYGLTQRLVRFEAVGEPGGSQRFGVKPAPGTSLDSLRERSGTRGQKLPADLDRLGQEGQKLREQKEIEKREAELGERERQERERAQREEDRARLEALQASPDSETTPPTEEHHAAPPAPAPVDEFPAPPVLPAPPAPPAPAP
jgi:hypothetical protein